MSQAEYDLAEWIVHNKDVLLSGIEGDLTKLHYLDALSEVVTRCLKAEAASELKMSHEEMETLFEGEEVKNVIKQIAKEWLI